MSRIVDPNEALNVMNEVFKGTFEPKMKVEMEVKLSEGQPGVMYLFTGRDPFEIDKQKKVDGFLIVPTEEDLIKELITKTRNDYLGIPNK